MNRRLHDVAADVLAFEDLLLESGGEWSPEAEALFAEVEGGLESKVNAYAALIREWELDAERWKAEEQRMAGHRRARENAAGRLKARLHEYLTMLGRPKVEAGAFTVAIQANAPQVDVLVLADQLPAAFVTEVPPVPASVVVNKPAILAALKAALPEKPKRAPDTPAEREQEQVARALCLVDRGGDAGAEIIREADLFPGEVPLARLVHSSHLRIR